MNEHDKNSVQQLNDDVNHDSIPGVKVGKDKKIYQQHEDLPEKSVPIESDKVMSFEAALDAANVGNVSNKSSEDGIVEKETSPSASLPSVAEPEVPKTREFGTTANVETVDSGVQTDKIYVCQLCNGGFLSDSLRSEHMKIWHKTKAPPKVQTKRKKDMTSTQSRKKKSLPESNAEKMMAAKKSNAKVVKRGVKRTLDQIYDDSDGSMDDDEEVTKNVSKKSFQKVKFIRDDDVEMIQKGKGEGKVKKPCKAPSFCRW